MAFIEKADFKLAILEEELNEIVRDDDALIDMAAEGAVEEMTVYLTDNYDVDAIFSATGTDRHKLLLRYGVDIAVYALVARTQGGQAVDDRKARYDRACKWLKKVESAEHYTNLPRREATQQAHITYGSGTRRTNYID